MDKGIQRGILDVVDIRELLGIRDKPDRDIIIKALPDEKHFIRFRCAPSGVQVRIVMGMGINDLYFEWATIKPVIEHLKKNLVYFTPKKGRQKGTKNKKK